MANRIWRCVSGVLLALAAAGGQTQVQAAAGQPCFSEEDWQALQRVSAPGGDGSALLYVWSPRMVLSAVHAHEVQTVAQSLGLQFVPVHDGRLPQQELEQALLALDARPDTHASQPAHVLHQSQPLCASSLIGQDAYRHFPTAWVVLKGGYHPTPLVSAMPKAYWRLGILLRMGDTAGASKAEREH